MVEDIVIPDEPMIPQAQPALLKKRSSKYDERIKICVDDIVGQFAECVVCFNIFNDPYITICGHTFCKECISEVVNIQHKCPICNHVL